MISWDLIRGASPTLTKKSSILAMLSRSLMSYLMMSGIAMGRSLPFRLKIISGNLLPLQNDGGESGIRTHGAYALRLSGPLSSTARPSLHVPGLTPRLCSGNADEVSLIEQPFGSSGIF